MRLYTLFGKKVQKTVEHQKTPSEIFPMAKIVLCLWVSLQRQLQPVAQFLLQSWRLQQRDGGAQLQKLAQNFFCIKPVKPEAQ
jgi:hypothetical protein